MFQKGLWTTYTHLLLYGLIRVGTQICGIAFSALGLKHYEWLVGYLILGVEGYFILVLSSFYLLGQVYEEGQGIKCNKFKKSLLSKSDGISINILGSEVTLRGLVFQYLVVANVILVVGGALLCSLKVDEYETNHSVINTSKALRGTGQILFLIMTLIVIAFAVYARFYENIQHYTITLIFFAAPFLMVRGVYGTLSCFITKMNYFKLSNYTQDGLTKYFVATEYCLAITMEFVSGCILISNFYIGKYKTARIVSSGLEDKNDREFESFAANI